MQQGLAPREVVLVLGMHRSGTSLAASVLAAMGCETGPLPQDGREENPDGFFELVAFRVLNVRMLAALGASWDNWGLHALEVRARLGELAPFRAEALALLASLPGTAPIMLKDPRTCTLLPFWTDVIAEAGMRARSVLVLRDPAEVARSQVQRAPHSPLFYATMMQAEPMTALWAVMMHGVLAVLPEDGAWLLCHADMFGAGAPTFAAMARHFGLPEATVAAAGARIRPELYRAKAMETPPNRGWPLLAQNLFADLTAKGGNRVLTRDDAAAILSRAGAIGDQRAFLPAIRSSLSGARDAIEMQAKDQQILLKSLRAVEVALRRNKDNASLADMEAALEDSPLDLDPVLLMIRITLAVQQGQGKRVEPLMRKLIAEHPQMRRPWLLLIGMLNRNGRAEEADAITQQARQHFPTDPAFAPEPAPPDPAP